MMNINSRILLLITLLTATQASAELNVLMQSTGMPESEEQEREETTVPVTRNRSEMIAKAALMASAAYNHTDLVNIRAKSNREQYDNAVRERLALEGNEIISFSATIKKSSLWGGAVAHGQLPAGLVSFSIEDNQPIIRIAFHGTESYRDLATDFNSFVSTIDESLVDGKIHRGFHNRYMESREAMFDVIEAVLDAHDLKAKNVHFVVTGHSLGAALATLAAVDLNNTIANRTKLYLVTFSSPRVFNHEGARSAEKILKGRALRVWRQRDIIPAALLGITGYKHVGKSVRLDRTNFLVWLGNHSMDTILENALSEDAVMFTTDHKGIIGTTKSAFSRFFGFFRR